MNVPDRNATPSLRLLGLAALGLAALALARPALAVDGVIEINQARAAAGNVTAGDNPGFPVSINTAGSYRLTSDLRTPSGFGAIEVNADDVTIDLNGFNVVCGGGSIVDGISLASHSNIEVKNGTIRGFTRDGIFSNISTSYVRLTGLRLIGNTIFGADLEGPANTVDGCTALNNGSIGIRVFDGSLVVNSVARGNASFGLIMNGPGGYRSNAFTGNNGGDANAQVSGGLQLGTNVCGSDTVCP